MNENEIKQNVELLVAEMKDRGFADPDVSLTLCSGYLFGEPNFSLHLSWWTEKSGSAGRTTKNYAQKEKYVRAVDAFDAAHEWLSSNDPETRKKTEAIEKTRNAIDAAVAAGIPAENLVAMHQALKELERK